MRTLGLLAVGLMLCSTFVFAGEYLMNDTEEVAVGLCVIFSEPVKITSFGDVLITVTPQGEASEFVFSGGAVESWGGHWMNWEPAVATLVSHEWIPIGAFNATGVNPALDNTLTLPEPNYKEEYNNSVGEAFAREAGSAIGADQLITNLGIDRPDLRMRYTTFLELLLRNTGNELAAVRSPDASIGPMDTLHHGWGPEEIRVYIGSEPNGTHAWVEQVLEEINRGIGREYLTPVSSPDRAKWVFGYSQVDYRNDRNVATSVRLDGDGDPEACEFRISGLFRFEDDFKTRLRGTIVQTLLLYKDYDPDLIERLGYDDKYFERTAFSSDFLHLADVLSALENGRDFSLDVNGVNQSPIAVLPRTMAAYVGETVELDGTGSSDLDGRITSYTWTQVFSSKTNLEYRTNNVADLNSPVEGLASFTPMWPGNYCFELRVADDSGASASARVHVEVTLDTNPFSIRGMDAFAYWDRSGLDSFTPKRLDELATVYGVEWIEFSPYWWMTDKHSSEVHPLGEWYPGCPGLTIKDADLVTLIELFHSKGLKVFLRPTLEFHNWSDWRGNLQPSDWQAWFSSYTQFILHYAKIAERTGVEMLAVGVELKNSNRFTDNWRSIIGQVREIYPGLLTYSDSGLTWGLSEIRFWDELNVIGCSSYVPITGSGPHWDTGLVALQDPTFQMFLRSIERAYMQNVLPVHERYGKPVLVAEAGCANYDGINLNPSLYDFRGKVPDNNEQVMYFEALFQVLSTKTWVTGVFPFVWAFKSDYNYQNEDWPISNDLRLKPAADVVRLWYSEQ
jgi:hypothetical protein